MYAIWWQRCNVILNHYFGIRQRNIVIFISSKSHMQICLTLNYLRIPFWGYLRNKGLKEATFSRSYRLKGNVLKIEL